MQITPWSTAVWWRPSWQHGSGGTCPIQLQKPLSPMRIRHASPLCPSHAFATPTFQIIRLMLETSQSADRTKCARAPDCMVLIRQHLEPAAHVSTLLASSCAIVSKPDAAGWLLDILYMSCRLMSLSGNLHLDQGRLGLARPYTLNPMPLYLVMVSEPEGSRALQLASLTRLTPGAVPQPRHWLAVMMAAVPQWHSRAQHSRLLPT